MDRRMVDVWLAQGLYYVLTGLWSVVSIRSFQRVTGPKTDLWLVKSVGVLLTVIGGVLSLARVRQYTGSEVSLLAVGSALNGEHRRDLCAQGADSANLSAGRRRSRAVYGSVCLASAPWKPTTLAVVALGVIAAES